MPRFCVNRNAQPTAAREHEVHNLDAKCGHYPEQQNQYYLGVFNTCQEAVAAALKIYDNVDGCKHCASACHTR